MLWGYYHVFKQHYGFMMMYKKKNRDFRPEDMKLDKVFFAAAFYYPFLTYPLHSKEAAAMLPFPIIPRLASIYENLLLFLVILVTLAYLVRQVQKWRQGLSLNWPKQLLFAAAIPVNYLLFRSGMPLLGVYAAVTIFHNVQYHRLVWFYNQNKYGQDSGGARKYGLATLVNARWLTYVAAAALYAIIFDVVPRFVLQDGSGPDEHRDPEPDYLFLLCRPRTAALLGGRSHLEGAVRPRTSNLFAALRWPRRPRLCQPTG